MSNFSYVFKLTSNYTDISLPYPIDCKKAKLKMLYFTTGSSGNQLLLVNVSGYNTNVYFDGTKLIKCFKAIPLPSSTATPVVYDGTSNSDFDVIRTDSTAVQTNKLTIELIIDGTYKDVTSLNPAYVEIALSN